MHEDRLRQLIADCGFEFIDPFDATKVSVNPSVRDMCAADKCQAFDRSWSCPPACGSLEECSAMMDGYEKGLIFQTVTELEDDFDFEGMMEGNELHGERFRELSKAVAAEIDFPILLLGAGSCTMCAKCTYPDHPCVHPDLMHPSMEACGLYVNEVAKLAGAESHHGPATYTMFSCVMYNE